MEPIVRSLDQLPVGTNARIVHVVTRSPESARAAIAAEAEARLKERLGVRIAVEVASPGELDAWTELHTSPKPKRFKDERG